MKILHMRRRLESAPGLAVPPAGTVLKGFDPPKHVEEVHSLLATGYVDGFGSVPPLEAWWKGISEDEEYDDSLVVLLVDREQRLIGVTHSWTSAFVKDLVVAKDARRRGVGAFLLRYCFHTFYERGAHAVHLKVQNENVVALALYKSVGMTIVHDDLGERP